MKSDTVIKPCGAADLQTIYEIVNEAAQAYKGMIPADRWHEPYMPLEALEGEIAQGVAFWGCWEAGELVGVMGLQDVQDVTLIRHAYVRPSHQGRGIGGRLLARLLQLARRPVLIGTWADAGWAIRFYQKHGFRQVTPAEKEILLRRYWSIPDRQVETSVVLADAAWVGLC